MKPVVLTPAAQAELEGATEWYEVRAGGIGLKFVLCVDEALLQISESPAGFPHWEQDVRFRRFVLQRFPYIVGLAADKKATRGGKWARSVETRVWIIS